MRPAALRHLPAVIVLAVFVYSGARGIDFGFHWDEDAWQIKPVQAMVRSGILLPNQYIYPSFNRWVVLMPAVVTGVSAGLDGLPARQVQAAMVAAFNGPGYLLTVRCVFLVLSALTLVWIYLAALAIDREWWKALIAMGAFGLTWEFAYHSRWVASDTICTQFAAMTMLGLALHHRTKKTAWLYGAAIAAGFCTGTKYPGVVVLATVLVAGAVSLPWRPVLPQLLRAAGLGFTAFGAYLVTTPATVLHPFDFYEQLKNINAYYGSGHFTYTVERGFAHFALVLKYFAFDFFSPYRGFAMLGFMGVLAGAVLRVREDKKLGVVLVSFPVFFCLFFCSKYNVFIVRNFLLITPFMALLLARAGAELFARLPSTKARQILAGAFVTVAALNAQWLWSAGESIRKPDPAEQVREAVEFVKGHPGTSYVVSNKVRQLAEQQGVTLPPNAMGSAATAQSVVFFVRAEGPPPTTLLVNDPWLADAVFGPREMNFSWYSTWEGPDRVVVMTVDKLRRSGVVLAN